MNLEKRLQETAEPWLAEIRFPGSWPHPDRLEAGRQVAALVSF